jgi:hypothetical protein
VLRHLTHSLWHGIIGQQQLHGYVGQLFYVTMSKWHVLAVSTHTTTMSTNISLVQPYCQMASRHCSPRYIRWETDGKKFNSKQKLESLSGNPRDNGWSVKRSLWTKLLVLWLGTQMNKFIVLDLGEDYIITLFAGWFLADSFWLMLICYERKTLLSYWLISISEQGE